MVTVKAKDHRLQYGQYSPPVLKGSDTTTSPGVLQASCARPSQDAHKMRVRGSEEGLEDGLGASFGRFKDPLTGILPKTS